MKKNIEKLFLLIATLFSVSVIAQGYDEAINPSNPNGQEGEAHIIMNPLDYNKLVVWQENYTIESGLNQLQLKTNGLSKGNYILKLSNNTGHFISRAFVKH